MHDDNEAPPMPHMYIAVKLLFKAGGERALKIVHGFADLSEID